MSGLTGEDFLCYISSSLSSFSLLCAYYLLMCREIITYQGGWNTGTGCPEKLWMPLPESVQGQVGWSSEQPSDIFPGTSTQGHLPHGRGIGTRWSSRSLPTLTILWFYYTICFKIWPPQPFGDNSAGKMKTYQNMKRQYKTQIIQVLFTVLH